MKENIDLPGQPWDVAPVNQHKVIVTFPFKKFIQFIQVMPSLALGHKVDLGMEVRGATVAHRRIYISIVDSGGSKIVIYALSGNKKRTLGPYDRKDGKLLFQKPYNIDVSNDETIFVSDEKSNSPTVNCLERNGNFLYILSICWFKQCFGIKVDENRNLLVCDWKSHKVFLKTRDGKKVSEFLTKKDGLYQPYTTSFRRSDGTLVVTCEDRNDILVFTLK